jgi:hypothetical protein
MAVCAAYRRGKDRRSSGLYFNRVSTYNNVKGVFMRVALLLLAAALAACPAAALHLYQPAHDYSDAELAELNWFELTLLAKEPYAAQGQVFDANWLMDHYLATDWYGPIHGSSEHMAAAMTFTDKEERDMTRFEEAAKALKPTYDGCWPVDDLAGMKVKHYRKLSSAQVPKVQLPPEFGELGVANGISVWSRPVVAAEDEVTTSRTDADPYYRVHVRSDGSIAAAEALARGEKGDYVLWEGRFDKAGALRLFHPIYRPDGKTSKVAIAAFAGGPDDTRVRCTISGDTSRVDMEVRGGPYSRLPFTVILYEERRDGAEVYKKLVGE